MFEAARGLSPAQQASFLDQECAGDVEIRREIEAILGAAQGPTDQRLKKLAGPNRDNAYQDTVVERPMRLVPDATEVLERQTSTGPATTLQPKAGMHIYQYELIRELGSGGMGAVYLARDTKLGRRVAIKFLQHSNRALSERFLLEAQATARCSHENIVVIHDVKEHGGVPFMVLEYLQGSTLGDLIGDDRVPPSRAVQLVVPVVRALVCAHQHKIVHRDLKPPNIFMTDTGIIKVLDFGVAKVVHTMIGMTEAAVHTVGPAATTPLALQLTNHGTLVGTLPYMSPEQWGADEVDHRSDIWAIGILLYRMVVGRHPLAPLGGQQLMVTAVLDQPMPSAHNAGVDMPLELADIIDSCLRKRKGERMPSAKKLLDALEPLLPGRRSVELQAGENPYTGLTAFQETDANRFFGRTREIGTVVARLQTAPLLGIVGPSGVGKSSFVRAGIIPALKQSGEQWETLVIRPGRHPMAALANIVVPMLTTAGTNPSAQVAEHQTALQRLYQEPGYLGTLLRSRARAHGRKILLFVDQFEELFTLIREADERMAFTACLAGMADDVLSPLRLMLSIRSDFLERVAEDQHFMNELSKHLVFLAPPDRAGLRDSIVRPAEMVRYRFETPAMVENMLDTLQATPGCLPLLQFAATKLWEARDRDRRLLTEQSYRRLGGVAGALATHADSVLASLPPRAQSLTRTIFLQLVTPERTRAIASVAELSELTDAPEDAERVIHQLVDARLLVIQRNNRGSSATVEIVHESLVHSWPTLTHWLDENQDDAVFLEQLRAAAKQWEGRDRSADLLWRGETLEEARSWRRRYRGMLPPLHEQFLHAGFALAARAARIKRVGMAGIIVFLSMLVVAAAVALVTIRSAEQRASEQALAARAAETRAEAKAAEAIAAEKKIREQLDIIRKKEVERVAALDQAQTFQERVDQSEEDLAEKNRQLTIALTEAERSRDQARQAQAKAEETSQELKRALAEAEAARKRAEDLRAREEGRQDRVKDTIGTEVKRTDKPLR
jgi:serine/threonine protein kinase